MTSEGKGDLEEMKSAGMYDHAVVDLAGVRLARGLTRRGLKKCEHLRLIVGQSERLIECEDCGRAVEAFDAFMVLTLHWEKMSSELRGKLYRADEALKAVTHRRAAKAVERVWSRHMAVCCHHCHHGLLPEDYENGAGGAVSRDIEIARRKRLRP